MPTSDIVRRRVQNRENQKKFRHRKSQQLSKLCAAFEAQSKRLAELEEETDVLRSLNARFYERLSAVNQVHDFSLRDVDEVVHSETATWPQTSRYKRWTSYDTCQPGLHIGISSNPPGQTARDGIQTSSLDINRQASVTLFSVSSDRSIPTPEHEANIILQTPDVGDAASEGLCSTTPQSDNWQTNDLPLPLGGSIYELSQPVDECEVFSLPQDAHGQQQIDQEQNLEANVEDLTSDLLIHNLSSFGSDPFRNLTVFPLTSRLSKHISAVSMLMQQKFGHVQSNILGHQAINYALAWMLRQAWQSSADCLKLMSVYQELFNYELWRNFPSKATYSRIHPMYRPTPVQLVVSHPPAIDWLPWPALREKAIELQDELDIDLLNMTALKHTVIERQPVHITGTSMASEPMTFRAWDVYLLEKIAGVPFSASDMTHTPRSSKTCALLRSFNLQISNLTLFRLDKAFFDVFPSLWSPEVATCCKVMPLRHSNLDLLRYPSDLSMESLTILENAVAKVLTNAYTAVGGSPVPNSNPLAQDGLMSIV